MDGCEVAPDALWDYRHSMRWMMTIVWLTGCTKSNGSGCHGIAC